MRSVPRQSVTALLKAIAIDRASPEPLHHQLFMELRRLILQGRLVPGSSLPQVSDLCKAFGFSTITATRAVAELKREGLVLTRRGVGMFVTGRPAPVTEVVVGLGGAGRPNPFLQSLAEGIKTGFGDPARRCVLTFFDGSPDAQELRDLMRSRRADSLVLFHPRPAVMEAAAGLGGEFPLVLVFGRFPGWIGDAVRPLPEPAFRAWLDARLTPGRPALYLAMKDLREPGEEDSPYRRLAGLFTEANLAKGIRPEVRLLDRPHNGTRVSLDPVLEKRLRRLPAGSLVAADTPHLAMQVRELNAKAEVLAYTESALSVEQFSGRVTLLYCGLDRAGQAAADLLRDRMARPDGPVRVIEVEAVVTGGAGEESNQ